MNIEIRINFFDSVAQKWMSNQPEDISVSGARSIIDVEFILETNYPTPNLY